LRRSPRSQLFPYTTLFRSGVDVEALWRASELVDQQIGDEPVTPLAPRIAVRAAEHRVPSGLVATLDGHLRSQAAGDRLDDVLEEDRKSTRLNSSHSQISYA